MFAVLLTLMAPRLTIFLQVGWIGTVALLMKTMIGLGVLSIPSAFDTLGLIPGIICLLVIAGITTWSDYMVGVFKIRHPEIYSIGDVGGLLFGRVGREIMGGAFCLCQYISEPINHLVQMLINSRRLDLCCGFRHFEHLHRPQRRLNARSLYGHLRRCCGHCWILTLQYSDSGKD